MNRSIKMRECGAFSDAYSYRTTISKKKITVKDPSGNSQFIFWDDILFVKVRYAETGLLDPDFWLILVSEANSCVIPRGGIGEKIVFNAFFESEGFDLEKFAESNDPDSNNTDYIIWRKPKLLKPKPKNSRVINVFLNLFPLFLKSFGTQALLASLFCSFLLILLQFWV